MQWYQRDAFQAIGELETSFERGLDGAEAERRLARHGANKLTEEPRASRLSRLLAQFTEFIILVLIGAAVVAGLLGEWVDSIAILAIVILNGVIGFLQEEKAERVLEALKRLTSPTARVLRDGELMVIEASLLVPGDIVALEAGDNVPADLRIIESRLLRIDEAVLTGESHAVDKEIDALTDTCSLGDRKNMAFSGTTIVYGRGRAVVVSTGMDTEMGRIARLLQEVKREPTPLQKRLAEFGRFLVYAAGAACALIFLLGLLRGVPLIDIFLTAVSLAVAAIPEGLPAVVTITLALGVQRMVKRNALVRKLPSVETLGAATIIASDKTGTITQNQMTVKKLYLATAEVVEVTGAGYGPEGEFVVEGSDGKVDLSELMKAVSLCNSAELKEEEGAWQVVGDPTEGALLTLAAKAGVIKKELEKELTFMGEIPFDSERKLMTVVYKDLEGTYHAFVKGAPERILALSTFKKGRDGAEPITEKDKKNFLEANEEFASGALRVLGVAYKSSKEPFDIHNAKLVESELVFTALVGMIDPPRTEVVDAVKRCVDAGITPLMITGDHKLTAMAIATEIGAFSPGDEAVTGAELDEMSDGELARRLCSIKVYARVNPEHKLRVVRAWRARGDIIAMTGDGVNDAPALKEADIGVAMGITGTDVTKEVSDMVLTDDNFASIVSAVEEGRGIFDNIRRVVHFLLSCNIGEIMVLLVAVLVGMPLPLLPIQILWTNLVTDGLPALGLAMEPVDERVMERQPRGAKEGIVTRRLLYVMLAQGAFMAACTLAVYAFVYYRMDGGELDKARTMAFVVLVFCQKFHSFNCRSELKSVFRIGLFSNPMLNLAVLFILISQVAIVYIPWLQGVFKVVPLAPLDWLIVIAASIQPLIWMEVVKFVRGGNGNGKNMV